MPELVRVSDKLTGHHYTVPRTVADSDPGRYRVLKSAAVDVNGAPVPPKPSIRKTTSAPAEATADLAADTTEAIKEATE